MLHKRIKNRLCGTFPHQGETYKKWSLLFILALFVGAGAVVFPQVANAANGYAGMNFGFAMGKFDKGSFEFKADDLARNEAVWRLFAGGEIHKNFGVEAGYIDFRKAQVTENLYNDYFETAISGFDVTPVGWLPVGKHFLVSARAGIIFWSSDMTSQSAVLGLTTKSESGSGLALGVGGNYDIGKWIRLRAEYMRYAVDKAKAGAGDFSVISISGMFVYNR